MPGHDDFPAGGSSSSRPKPSPWLLGFAGIGLFLAGGMLGAIVILSITLYRMPASQPTSAPILGERTLVPTDIPPTILPLPTEATPLPYPPTHPPIGPAVGQEAPTFVLAGLDGREYDLAAFRGHAVLVHFWASWCPPCQVEWPELRAFVERTDSEIVLLAVNVEEPDEVVREFVGNEVMPFPVLLDEQGDVNERYRITVLPTTFLLDAKGIVLQVIPGDMDQTALQRLVEANLSQP